MKKEDNMEKNKVKTVKTPFGYKIKVGAMKNVGISKIFIKNK